MTKEELIEITLKQLNDSFETSPECFQVEDTTSTLVGPMITWTFKIDLDGKTIPDPNNSNKTIVISYSDMNKTLSCFIFLTAATTVSRFGSAAADADASIRLNFPILNRSYRDFMRLRKKVMTRRNNQEGMRYLSKLRAIFPSTHDDELLS